MNDELPTEPMQHEGVWCCERKCECRWQGFALHRGLAWGTVPPYTDTWRQRHNSYCGGKLVQLVPRGDEKKREVK